MKNKEETLFIKSRNESIEELKNRIITYTEFLVRRLNDDNLNKSLQPVEPGEIKDLTGGRYPTYISLSKADYERLLNEKTSVIDNHKILGMEIIVRKNKFEGGR